MEMEKVYCIKNFSNEYMNKHHRNLYPKTLFEKGKIYYLRRNSIGGIHSVWYSKQSGVTMNNKEFEKHFITIKDVRKLKLEKLSN